jgi:hypothetical protein
MFPQPLQQDQDLAFHLGCDMRVDLFQLVRQVVSHPPGRRDLRNVIGGHPGFVAMPEPVEAQSRLDRVQPPIPVTVDRGPKHSPVEVAAPQPSAAWRGEHELARVLRQVLAQQVGEERWELNGAGRRWGLRFTPNGGQVVKQLSLLLSGTARSEQG